MSVSRIASRYAKSLIELSVEGKKLDQVLEDMKMLQRLTKNRDFKVMLKSPVLPEHKKTKVVNHLLEGKLDDLTMKFILLLIQKNRELYLPEIIVEFIEQYKEIKNIHTVQVTSAQPLDQKTLDHIERKLREETDLTDEDTVDFVTQTDTDMIGGFVLKYKDFIFDTSVATQLEDMRRKQFGSNLYRSQIRAR